LVSQEPCLFLIIVVAIMGKKSLRNDEVGGGKGLANSRKRDLLEIMRGSVKVLRAGFTRKGGRIKKIKARKNGEKPEVREGR